MSLIISSASVNSLTDMATSKTYQASTSIPFIAAYSKGIKTLFLYFFYS